MSVTSEVGPMIIPILQMWKPRYRKVKQFAQGRISSKRRTDPEYKSKSVWLQSLRS